MSQNNAKIVESTSSAGNKKEDEKMGLELIEGSDVNISQAERGPSCSKLGGGAAVIHNYGIKDKTGAQISKGSLVDPKAILNEDEIAEVAKLLEYKDLKSLHQVDTHWSDSVSRILATKSILVLESGEAEEEELQRFQEAFLNWRGLTTIKFTFQSEFKFERGPEMFNDILAIFSTKLKSLEFAALSTDFLFLPRASIHFSALTSLTIDNSSDTNLNYYNLFNRLYSSAPKLTELTVAELNYSVLSPIQVSPNSRNLDLVPHLNSISVRNPLSPEKLSHLTNFPQNWWCLELLLYASTSEDVQRLSQLLENNRDSLRSLKLNLGMCNSFQTTFNFPSFSKLQKLELTIFLSLEMKQVTFGPDSINYSMIFPTLTSFEVNFFLEEDSDPLPVWQFLFSPQKFKGLNNFKLDFRNLDNVGDDYGNDYHQFIHEHRIDEVWAAAMFPTAQRQINRALV